MNDTIAGYSPPAWIDVARCPAGLAICPLGILSSILIIISLTRKVITEKKVFFILMIAVAILDLFFNCTFLFIRCSPLTYTSAVVHAFVFSASLASDLCALALTAERYLALCWPQTMQNLSPRIAKLMRVTVALLIVVVSSVRAQYMVEDLNALEPLSESFKREWEPIYMALSIFGDMVLPVVLTLTMIFFSVKIIIVVVRRQRSRVKVGPEAVSRLRAPVAMPTAVSFVSHGNRRASRNAGKKHQNVAALGNFHDDPEFGAASHGHGSKKADDINSVVSLVLVLDLFFILNQFGYMFYAVSEVIQAHCYGCKAELDLYNTAMFVSDCLECMSRSLHFYFYVKFSQLLRQEFLGVVGMVRKCFCRCK